MHKKKWIKSLIGGIFLLSVMGTGAYIILKQNGSDKNDLPTNEEAPSESEKRTNLLILSPIQIESAQISLLPVIGATLSIKTQVPGKITANPNRYAHITSKTHAVVREVNKNLGDHVKAGDILAILESREIAEAKAEYLAALRQLRLASDILLREGNLQNKRISAEQDFLHAEATAEGANITLMLAEQKLLTLGLNEDEIKGLPNNKSGDLRVYLLKAPFDGTVIKRHMTKGKFINTDEEAFIVADLEQVWVEMGIYPKDIERIRQGQQLEVTSDTSGKIAEAKLIYLSPVINEQTHMTMGIAELDNSTGSWRPGSFVTVEIISQVVPVPETVQKEAIQRIDNVDYVFVKAEEGFEQRAVEVGRNDGKLVEVISGLSAGEMYAATNTFILKAEVSKTPEDE